MNDIYQEIILRSDLNTLKNMYFVNQELKSLLDSGYINRLLSEKYHTCTSNFKNFINNHGRLTIPQKIKHGKEEGSYFTHFNGEQLFNVRIKNDVVSIHTEGWEPDSDESSSDFPIEGEACYSSAPLITLKPSKIFLGRDPFNNHEEYLDLYNYNPNVNNDPDFYKREIELKKLENDFYPLRIYHSEESESDEDETDESESGEDDELEENESDEANELDEEENKDIDESDEGELESDDEESGELSDESMMDLYNQGYYFPMDRSGFDGSNILLEVNKYDYIYIDSKVYAFTALAKIVSFVSCEGNNDVPYAHAVDEYNNIYLFSVGEPNKNGVIIKMTNELAKSWQPAKSGSSMPKNDEFHINPYQYYFFGTTDEEKLEDRFIPIIATHTYYNGMCKYGN